MEREIEKIISIIHSQGFSYIVSNLGLGKEDSIIIRKRYKKAYTTRFSLQFSNNNSRISIINENNIRRLNLIDIFYTCL